MYNQHEMTIKKCLAKSRREKSKMWCYSYKKKSETIGNKLLIVSLVVKAKQKIKALKLLFKAQNNIARYHTRLLHQLALKKNNL